MPDTVLVTGASGGLGGAVVEVLEGAGWTVAALGRDHADLTDPDDTARAMGAIEGPAAVVNLVGGFASGPRVHELDPAGFARMVELNLTTTFNVARAAIPALLEHGGGAFVAISAKAAERPFAGAAAYASAKAAVLAFVRALDAEYHADGVRANVLLPGVIDTPANREAMPNSDRSGRTAPAEIAEVVRFLLSDEASAVHGAAIPV
ncbi:MAG: SDR family NAD(P)-dependent oxidoreductase [Actinomycetota bacterium]|nr:SDR family NAD(P)-dependent oxidoreductase [Actinomycetota bacterium]